MTDDSHLWVHYTQLPPPAPDNDLAVEWDFYRREVGRLLAEGHEGRHVLIKGEQVLGTWGTREEALEAGRRRFLMEPILVHQVLTRERVYQGPRGF